LISSLHAKTIDKLPIKLRRRRKIYKNEKHRKNMMSLRATRARPLPEFMKHIHAPTFNRMQQRCRLRYAFKRIFNRRKSTRSPVFALWLAWNAALVSVPAANGTAVLTAVGEEGTST
jgi:hypothetical protein